VLKRFNTGGSTPVAKEVYAMRLNRWLLGLMMGALCLSYAPAQVVFSFETPDLHGYADDADPSDYCEAVELGQLLADYPVYRWRDRWELLDACEMARRVPLAYQQRCARYLAAPSHRAATAAGHHGSRWRVCAMGELYRRVQR
jgi:hypothetical protein